MAWPHFLAFRKRPSVFRTMQVELSLVPCRRPSFYSLFYPFQVRRDVFFRETQCATCAITRQALPSNFTHHCRAGDATTKLPHILNGVLRSLALQRWASLHFLRHLLFHISFTRIYPISSDALLLCNISATRSDLPVLEARERHLACSTAKRICL